MTALERYIEQHQLPEQERPISIGEIIDTTIYGALNGVVYPPGWIHESTRIGDMRVDGDMIHITIEGIVRQPIERIHTVITLRDDSI